MEMSKYLPIGTTVADKYEIVDILGEDDFEILYLVRDFQRKTSFFVLKELFLETFSLRDKELVTTLSEAKGVFEKRKKQIIEEIESKKLNPKNMDIKIYGYEEENNTVYTVMEFSNNANLDRYLQFSPNKGVNTLPALNELIDQEKKETLFSRYLKIFLMLVTLFLLFFYAYHYFQEERHEDAKEVIENEVNVTKKIVVEERTFEEKEFVVMESNSSNNSKIEEFLVSESEANSSDEDNHSMLIETERLDETDSEQNLTSPEMNMSTTLPNKVSLEAIQEENRSSTVPIVVQEPVIKEINSTISIEMRIKSFLDDYIKSSSTGSISDTLNYYDTRVKKYFRFTNATHNTIRKSKQRYNKKWHNRSFEIVDFKIVKSYQKNSINYFDVKTTTVWTVYNQKNQKLSGKSKGIMTLKEVKNSFKIVSIVTVK